MRAPRVLLGKLSFIMSTLMHASARVQFPRSEASLTALLCAVFFPGFVSERTAGDALLQKGKISTHALLSAKEETKTIYVVFNSLDDTKNAAMLIMDAMEEAGLTLEAWAPLTAHQIPDDDATFPLTMDVEFERRPSVSALADTTPASAQAPLPENEKQDENQALVDLHLEDEGSELRTSSLLEASYMERSLVANEANIKPTKTQVNWAARNLPKFLKPICSRHRENKAAPYARGTYAKWLWETCDTGYEDILGICYQNCVPGYYAVWFTCHQSCNMNQEDTLSECIERCADVPGPPSPIDTTCSLFYCGKSAGDCTSHATGIVSTFAMSFVNIVLLKMSAANLVRKLTWKAVGGKVVMKWLTVKMQAKEIAKFLLPKVASATFKAAMVANEDFKKLTQDAQDALEEAILQKGAEEVAQAYIAETATGDDKVTALEILEAMDPTGIAKIVRSFEADRCRDMIIDPFPGLGGEALDNKNGAPIYAYDLISVSGICKGVSVAMERKDDINECAKACNARSDCSYIAYCPKGEDDCTGVHENMCRMYSGCGDKDTTAEYQGYITLGATGATTNDISCGGDYLKYCNSFADLKQHYCNGNDCTTDDQKRNCEAHFNSHAKAEHADGRRSSPTCPDGISCGGDYRKYCSSYPDLKQHYCNGNYCTTDDQWRNCEAHFNSHAKAEIADGRRSLPTCPDKA